MPDRWLTLCRTLVPAAVRQTTFDPAVADLELDWASRGAPSGVGRWRARFAILGVALECRRLAAHAGVSARMPHPGAGLMTFIKDVRVAVRRLVRQPAFSLIAVLTLALGIGANLSVFSFADAMLLAPVRAEEPERLVRVYPRGDDGGNDIVSFLNYRDARDGAASLDLAAHQQAPVEVGEAGAGGQVRTAELVTGNFFRVLRLTPLAGRLIDEQDDAGELAHPVVVLSEAYWRAAMGGAPDAVGRSMVLNGTAFTIVGIAPAGFRGTFNAHAVDLWVPVSMQQVARPRGLTLERRGWGWLSMIGRLRPEATIDDARRQLAQVAADLDQRFPSRGPATAFTVTPALAVSESDSRILGPVLGATFAFTALLFVVTCANLAGVMQSRIGLRRRELAIRQSLGANRGRLAWEWMIECLLISGAGAAVGLIAAALTTALVSSVELPAELVGNMRLAAPVGGRVIGYAAALAVMASLIFGVWPAWRASRADASGFLKDDGATVTGGRQRARGRRIAVAVQVALSVVLLVAAGLLATSVNRRQAFSPGFATADLGLLSINPQRQRIAPGAWRALGDLALETVRRDPGVVDADLGFRPPLGLGGDVQTFRIPGHTGPDGSEQISIDFNVVGSRYFSTLGASFIAGRAWEPVAAAAAPAAVINETMARRYWPNGDAVGQTVELGGTTKIAISGVVRDTAYYEIGEAPIPYIFLSAESRMPATWVLHIRTSGDPAPVLARLARALPAADARLSPFDVVPFEALRRAPLFPARVLAATASVFGALALVLTAVGLYGVVAASVAQRTREIGLRLALGARPGLVLRGVLGEAGMLAAAGAALGLAGGYVTANALRGWLVDVSPFDPLVYAMVAAVLVVITLVAAWLPARRAAAVDPLTAIRNQ
jgi:predicted permease